MLTGISRSDSLTDVGAALDAAPAGADKRRPYKMPPKSKSAATPASLGFRMPAEWEPQEAVWLSWPRKRSTWPGHFRPIPKKFAEIVAQISRFEKVRINCAAA